MSPLSPEPSSGGYPPPTGSPVIAGAPPGPRKRWPRVLFWVSIGLIVVGVVGAVGDWAARTYEMNQLLTRIEASEQSMVDTQSAIEAVSLPEDATASQKDAAKKELEQASAVGRDEVNAAGTQIAALTFLPWHSEIISAQGAYLAHNGAWVDYLDRGSTQPLTLFGDDNRIEPTWIAAEKYVRAGVPVPALPMITTRVDDIFRDEEPAQQDDGGGIPA